MSPFFKKNALEFFRFKIHDMYRIIFLICVFFSFKISVFSQNVYPVSVIATPIMNGTVYLSDYSNPDVLATRLHFTITLNDPVEPSRQISFRATILENGTEVLRTDPSYQGPVFTIFKGIPLDVYGYELSEYLNPDHMVGVSGNTGGNVLREGFNSICLEVIDVQRNEPISGKICASGYWAKLHPPLLTLPMNQSLINNAMLANLTFHWQMPDPIANLFNLNINYHFELREMLQGMDPQDAFEAHNLIYQADINQQYLQYLEIPTPLEPGKTYLWRVQCQVFDELNEPVKGYFTNNGISEVHTFQVVNEQWGARNFSGVNLCQCIDCTPPPIVNFQLEHQLAEGDTLHYGIFDVLITNLTNSIGSNASGSGILNLPFLNTGLSVSFFGCQVNTDARVLDGSIEVNTSSLVKDLIPQANGAISFGELKTDKGWFTNMFAHFQESGEYRSLPVSVKNNVLLNSLILPEDLWITGMYITTEGATLDMIMLASDGNGGHVRFGASGVKFGRSGFNLSGVKLYLAEQTAYQEKGKEPVLLNKSVSSLPELGSFAEFDCNGFSYYNLQAIPQNGTDKTPFVLRIKQLDSSK